MDGEKSNVDERLKECLVCGYYHRPDQFCAGAPCPHCGQRGIHRCPEVVRLTLIEQSAREFWERAFIACIGIAWEQKCPEAPFSHRAAELATASMDRWREQFNPGKDPSK